MIGDGAPELVRRALAIGGAVFDPSPCRICSSAIGVLSGQRHRLDAGISRRGGDAGRPARRGLSYGGLHQQVQRPTMKILDFLTSPAFSMGGRRRCGAARKPDPRHLLAGLALVGARPEQAVMIGDGINDVDAAKAAVFRCCCWSRAMVRSRQPARGDRRSPGSAISPRRSPSFPKVEARR